MIKQKKESVNLKTGHLKLLILSSKGERESQRERERERDQHRHYESHSRKKERKGQRDYFQTFSLGTLKNSQLIS